MAEESNNTTDNKVYYWVIWSLLLVLSLALGIVGSRKYFIHHGEEDYWIRCVYKALQLLVLENGDLPGPIPWELHVARFTAPLTTALALVLALLEILREQWMRIKIAGMRGHVVIVGFGTKGKNVMAECVRIKEKILIIETDPRNPDLSSNLPPKCRLLIGDANDKGTLLKARIRRAKCVFLLMGDDAQQVDVCLRIYQLIRESKRDESNALRCVMHLQKQEFLNTIRNYRLVQHIDEGFDLRVFNVYENSARELFEDNPPDRSGITAASESFVQMMIFGFGQAGEALALQCAQTGHYANGKKPKVLIIDRLAKEKVPDFLERYPTFTDYCDLVYLALEAKSPQLIQHVVKYLEDPRAFTTAVVCFDNQTHNLLLGLQLDSLQVSGSGKPSQVFVRTSENESFTTLDRNVKPYGLPSRVCSLEAILEGGLDGIAEAIHENYLKSREKAPDFGAREADAAWKRLSQEFKDSNRKEADHIGVKMRGIGCSIVSTDDPRPAAILTEEEIDQLAELEHRRWCAERSLAGWTFGSVKNDKTRRTPFLTHWNQLEEKMKSYDRDAVRNIPAVLGLVGMKTVRTERPQ